MDWPVPFLGMFLLLGLALGSFGTVLVDRLPKGEGIGGRSRCPSCGKTLAVWELIPVVSFLLLRGRCRACGALIPVLYPLLEVSSGVLFILAGMVSHPSTLSGLSLALTLWCLLMISILDARTQRIPDALLVGLLLCGIPYNLLHGTIDLWAPLLGMTFFGLQWLLSYGRWVGSGDVFLASAIGFLLPSWHQMFLALLLAYLAGAVVGLPLLLLGRWRRGAHIPFGPFLAFGGAVALLYGDAILAVLLW